LLRRVSREIGYWSANTIRVPLRLGRGTGGRSAAPVVASVGRALPAGVGPEGRR
jgi:hypothetical protein